MRTIEDAYVDRITAKDLGLFDDPEINDALNMDVGEDFSINEEGIWGNNIDVKEFEDAQLTIRTEQTMNFMGYKGTTKF